MDYVDSPVEIMSTVSLLLLLLLSAHQALSEAAVPNDEGDSDVDVDMMSMLNEDSMMDGNRVSRSVLLHFRLWNNLSFLDEDLGFWVKPRSTTWFSRFLLEEYDDNRWVQLFRMSKRSVFLLAELLAPHIRRKDTRYRHAVPVLVRVACTLFKLSHGASLLICSEMFAVGRSIVSLILRDVVHTVNVVLRREIAWPRGRQIVSTATRFQDLCGLLGVMGAIDGTHIGIKRPRFGSVDYFYFKSGGFSMNCQAVVDSAKRFLDLYVGMPGSTNDSRMLRRSTLYHRGQANSLWRASASFQGFQPYVLGDAGYPLLPWLMVPHRRLRALSLSEHLFNRRLSKGRAVVETAFGQLKVTWRELQRTSDLNVSFLPDVVMACCILHNVLLKQSHREVEHLLQVLQEEGFQRESEEEPIVGGDGEAVAGDEEVLAGSHQKRQDLGVYLSLQRSVPR